MEEKGEWRRKGAIARRRPKDSRNVIGHRKQQGVNIKGETRRDETRRDETRRDEKETRADSRKAKQGGDADET